MVNREGETLTMIGFLRTVLVVLLVSVVVRVMMMVVGGGVGCSDGGGCVSTRGGADVNVSQGVMFSTGTSPILSLESSHLLFMFKHVVRQVAAI